MRMENHKMDKFFTKIAKSLQKNSREAADNGGCRVWKGCIDRYGYGTKRVTWPDGSVKLERVHRVSYMAHHRIFRQDMPHREADGLLEISHICHNKLCIEPNHLVLESHETNCERRSCQLVGECVRNHVPPCIFFR